MRAQTKAGAEVWLNLSTVIVPSRNRVLSVLVHMFREVTRDHAVLSVVKDLVDMVSADSPDERTPGLREVSNRADCIELTRREREILRLLTTGISTDAMADRLCISKRTVRNHVDHILGKLDVHSRLEAVAYSIKNGLA